jgi:hypothetical protein
VVKIVYGPVWGMENVIQSVEFLSVIMIRMTVPQALQLVISPIPLNAVKDVNGIG